MRGRFSPRSRLSEIGWLLVFSGSNGPCPQKEPSSCRKPTTRRLPSPGASQDASKSLQSHRTALLNATKLSSTQLPVAILGPGAPRFAYARPLRPGSQPLSRAMPRAPKSPAGITAQAAQDEASELGKQRSKSPGNQCTTTTVPIQSLHSTPDRDPLLFKPKKRCQLIDGQRYRDTARANTAGHQR